MKPIVRLRVIHKGQRADGMGRSPGDDYPLAEFGRTPQGHAVALTAAPGIQAEAAREHPLLGNRIALGVLVEALLNEVLTGGLSNTDLGRTMRNRAIAEADRPVVKAPPQRCQHTQEMFPEQVEQVRLLEEAQEPLNPNPQVELF